jgi:hypothetical protein
LLYGTEFWRVKARDINALTAEVRYLRRVKNYVRIDHTKEVDVRKELKIQSV